MERNFEYLSPSKIHRFNDTSYYEKNGLLTMLELNVNFVTNESGQKFVLIDDINPTQSAFSSSFAPCSSSTSSKSTSLSPSKKRPLEKPSPSENVPNKQIKWYRHNFNRIRSKKIYKSLLDRSQIQGSFRDQIVVYDSSFPETTIKCQYIGVEPHPGVSKDDVSKYDLSDVRWIYNAGKKHIILQTSQILDSKENKKVIIDVYTDAEREGIRANTSLKSFKNSVEYQSRNNKK